MRILFLVSAIIALGFSKECIAHSLQVEPELSTLDSPSLVPPLDPLPSYIAQIDDSTMLRKMVIVADCVVMREPKAITNFLKNGRYADPNNTEVRDIVGGNRICLKDGSMKFNQVLFAGAAAESVYRVSGLLFSNYADEILKSKNNEALCVARDKPKQLDDLLATLPASNEEKSALAALDETIDRCRPNISRHASIRRAAIMAGIFPAAYAIFGPH